MQKNFIWRVIEHYTESGHALPSDELTKAWEIFTQDLPEIYIEKLQPLFSEWMLFEYRPKIGKGKDMTLLERWVAENPQGVGSMTLRAYRAILTSQRYSWFVVREVHIDEKLVLEDIKDGTIHEVREHAATYELKKGVTIITRIAQVEDHFEIVSASVQSVGVTFEEGMRKQLRNAWKKYPWGIRDTCMMLYGDEKKEGERNKNSHAGMVSPFLKPVEWYAEHPEELELRMQELFKNIGIDSFVSVALVRKWVIRAHTLKDTSASREERIEAFNAPPSLLLGLMPPDCTEEDTKALLDAYSLLNNAILLAREWSKTPYARFKETNENIKREREENEGTPHIILSSAQFDWEKYMHNGIMFMKKDIKKARKAFDTTFKKLLANHTTYPEIYRLFANTGITYFAEGEQQIGLRFLEYALALNPKYTFARAQLQRLRKVLPVVIAPPEIRSIIKNILKARDKKSKKMCTQLGLTLDTQKLALSPPEQYYVWLQKWGIAFETKKPPLMNKISRKIVTRTHTSRAPKAKKI